MVTEKDSTEARWKYLRLIDSVGSKSLSVGCRFVTQRTRLLPPRTEVTLVRLTQVRGFRGGWEDRLHVRDDSGQEAILGSWASLRQITFPPLSTIEAKIESRNRYFEEMDSYRW